MPAEQVADDALATANNLQPKLEGEALALQGQPADVLLEQAADATLIVVGRAGLRASGAYCSDRSANRSFSTRPAPVVVVNQPATESTQRG